MLGHSHQWENTLCYIWKLTSEKQNVAPSCIRAIKGHSGAKKINRAFVKELYHNGYAKCEKAIEGTCVVPGGYDQNKGRQAVHVTLVNLLDKNPNTKYKADKHFESHHDAIYVVNTEGAAEELQVPPNARWLRFLFRRDPQGFCIKQVIHIRDRSETYARSQCSRTHFVNMAPVTTSWSQTMNISYANVVEKDTCYSKFFEKTEVSHTSGDSLHHQKKIGNTKEEMMCSSFAEIWSIDHVYHEKQIAKAW